MWVKKYRCLLWCRYSRSKICICSDVKQDIRVRHIQRLVSLYELILNGGRLHDPRGLSES